MSLVDVITFSGGTISGNTTQETSVSIGWGTIVVCAVAAKTAKAVTIALVPLLGARVVAATAVCVILLVSIFNKNL